MRGFTHVVRPRAIPDLCAGRWRGDLSRLPTSWPVGPSTLSGVRVLCVGGARPNFMKVKPVMDGLLARDAEVVLVHTGQHYDLDMSEVFLSELGMRPPDHHLGVGSASQATQTARVMEAFEPLVAETRPDVVVVVGDVNSTAACALVAAKSGSLVAHVEAGLRSRDWSMPEEVNRVITDRVSDYLFAPSPDAADNLRVEGYRPDQIHVVGNVMVDSLLANLDAARRRPVLRQHGLGERGYGLVTLHRPANVDDRAVLDPLLGALVQLSLQLPLVFPVHPRARGAITEVLSVLKGCVLLLPPAGYLDFIALEAGARLVLTDSGGVQEETTVLGVPCLTLRENTERPITVTEGTNRVVGRDPARILMEAQRVLDEGVPPRRPALWDGCAGQRIAEVIVAGGGPVGHPRPTDSP